MDESERACSAGERSGPATANGDSPAPEPAESLLERLRRIELLRTGGGPSEALLAELRALVPEAEAWVRSEGDARARQAVAKLREGAEGMT